MSASTGMSFFGLGIVLVLLISLLALAFSIVALVLSIRNTTKNKDK